MVEMNPTVEPTQKHHALNFWFMSEDDCKALKSVTTWQSGKKYRLLPGSTSDALPYGVWVYCNAGSSASGTLWKTTDTE